MASMELSSFIKKFESLRSSGYDASLLIENKLDEMSITLSCKVGRDIPPPSQTFTPGINSRNRRSPSYYRRQARRQAFRCNVENVVECNSETEQVVEDVSTELQAVEKATVVKAEDMEAQEELIDDEDTESEAAEDLSPVEISRGQYSEMEEDVKYDDLNVQLEAIIKESQTRRQYWDQVKKENG